MALVTAAELAAALHMAEAQDTAGLTQAAAAADVIVTGLLTALDADGQPIDHSLHPQDKEAALQVAVEVYQARNAAGGQAVAADWTPGPYRLSVWLTRRVASLTAPCADVGGWVG